MWLRVTLILLAVSLPVQSDGASNADTVVAKAVWTGPNVSALGTPSQDGRYLSHVDLASGELAVRDLETGESRLVTHKDPGTETGQFAYFSAMSSDGERIAYAWFNESRFYELRTIRTDGSETRVLYRNPEAGFVQPCAWSPDGSTILTLLFRKDNISQIALISADDGSARILRSLNWVYPKRMDLSPNGRFIVYDATVRDDAPERDIHILAVDGSSQTVLTDHPALDLFPLWSPDGNSIIFGSDRTGTMDAWLIPVRDGKPAGEARLLKKDLGRVLPLGITKDGQYYYGLRTGTTDVLTATFDWETGQLKGKPVTVKSRLAGGNSKPAWSPDGRYLAYLSRLGTENYGQEYRVISVHDTRTGQEKTFPPGLAYVGRIRWAPDGRALLLSGSDSKGPSGLFRLSLTDGGVEPLVEEHGVSYRGFEGVWSKDGRKVFYIHDLGREDVSVGVLDMQTRERHDLYRPAGPAKLHLVAISPDGDRLAFAEAKGEQGSSEALLTMEVDGGRPRTILRSRNGGLLDIEWAPDSKHLLVSAPGDPAPALWKVSIDEGHPVRMDLTLKRDGGIRLSPDGRHIAFTVGDEKSEIWSMELAELLHGPEERKVAVGSRR